MTALGLVVVALILFVGLALLVSSGATRTFDDAVLLWFDRLSTPRFDIAATDFTALGSAPIATVVALVATLLFLQRGRVLATTHLWAALVGGWIINAWLKSIIARPRPDLLAWGVPYAGGASYPSGHATTATIIYLTLGYYAVRRVSSRFQRLLTIITFVAITFLVGVSRVYLGVHYPTDVLGGFLIGVAWAILCAEGTEVLRRHLHEPASGASKE